MRRNIQFGAAAVVGIVVASRSVVGGAVLRKRSAERNESAPTPKRSWYGHGSTAGRLTTGHLLVTDNPPQSGRKGVPWIIKNKGGLPNLVAEAPHT